MKCYYCGFEAPIIARSSNNNDLEFIDQFIEDNFIYPIIVCPKCKKVQ